MQFLRCATINDVVAWLISSSIFMAVEGKQEKKKRKNDWTAQLFEPEENLISQSILREPW